MGTELLKEQYNTLLNEQKNKLEKLKQKKLMVQQKNNGFNSNSNKIDDDDQNDSELDEKGLDLDNDLFSKFNKLDNMDSSSEDDTVKKKPIKSAPKVFDKKNMLKTNEKIITKTSDSIEQSLSFADKLRELKDENGKFRKLLAEKDYEVNYLKKKIEEERDALGMAPVTGDAAATRIVDLSKKVRELTAYLESEKTKNKQLNKNLKDMENKFEIYKKKANTKNNEDEDENDENNESDNGDGNQEKVKVSLSKENKELKEKLNQTTHKMMEYKSQCEILKQDLKKTQKALEKEVGENFDTKAILAGQGNWKGRQQQIRMLQNKINELKQQVGMMDARASQMLLDEEDLDETGYLKDGYKSAGQNSSISGFTFNSNTTRTNFESKHKIDLRRIERDKKEQLEKTKREYDALENDYNSIKDKLEAAKSRNKVLANENKTFKDQVKTLLEKGKHDDELIEALMKKQNQLKDVLQNLNYENEQASKQLEDKSKEAQIKNMQEKNTIDQLKAIILERENKVKQLENELNTIKENYNQISNEKFYLHATKYENSEDSIIIQRNSNNENGNNREYESIKNNRPLSSNNFARNRSDSIDREMTSSRLSNKNGKNQRPQSSNGLNAKSIEQKKEHSIDFKLEYNELKTLNKTSEIERLRLMELVKTLQKRIEELNDKAMENENKYNEQRRRCANLEKQIEKFKLQDPKTLNLNKQKSAIQTNNLTSIDQYKLDELETSLLIQKDENDALKAALKSTLEAKEEDLRLYVEMLESTKRVYLDGLKQYKQIASSN